MFRIYDEIIKDHFHNNDQMLLIAGPRQVGKTTTSKTAANLTNNFNYLSWDSDGHKMLILNGQTAIAEYCGIQQLREQKPVVVFDEIHKYEGWKNFLKGFYDSYHDQINIIVTGSSRLDIFKKGGDSLMGRYFLYRMHPLSVAECITTELIDQEIRKPRPIKQKDWDSLITMGGFPKPFLKNDPRFYKRWQRLRSQQLIREDIRDLSRIHEIDRLEVLSQLLKLQAGQLTNYSSLAKKIRVSVDTITRWINTLESFYYCFTIKPWSKNISRSLIKEPKVYLWDWSQIQDKGMRFENFIASHLLKAVHFWTDQGFGEYELYFLRDLEKREVDFLISKDGQPWFLVEVKHTNNSSISKNLLYFQEQSKAPHAFQVVKNMSYVNKDCFAVNKPVIVPAKTFLSQLI